MKIGGGGESIQLLHENIKVIDPKVFKIFLCNMQ
jgi:hypothetical protein